MKKISVILALMVVLAFCIPVMAQDTIKICQVTDTGGVDDKSFNETAWNGVLQAEEKYGVEGVVLESTSDADYAVNIEQFIDDECDLIITVGYMLSDATIAAADMYPDYKFSTIDASISKPNTVDQIFQTDEAAFLAGYVAAAVTKTGVIGTFGGMCIPTVTIFMDGYARGAAYYNETHGTDVKVIGWDLENPDVKTAGTCVDSFDDLEKGKQVTITMMDQGADIIMPVAGPVGGGTIAAMEDRGTGMVIGVDSDWYYAYPENTDMILTSVVKKMDATTLGVIGSVVDGTFAGGSIVGTLANTGVDLAPFHDLESAVPADVIADLATIREKIVSGEIEMNPEFAQVK
ncbi:MAG: BMP family protein [Flexilinea sp.]